jgi:hypothetical protein
MILTPPPAHLSLTLKASLFPEFLEVLEVLPNPNLSNLFFSSLSSLRSRISSNIASQPSNSALSMSPVAGTLGAVRGATSSRGSYDFSKYLSIFDGGGENDDGCGDGGREEVSGDIAVRDEDESGWTWCWCRDGSTRSELGVIEGERLRLALRSRHESSDRVSESEGECVHPEATFSASTVREELWECDRRLCLRRRRLAVFKGD